VTETIHPLRIFAACSECGEQMPAAASNMCIHCELLSMPTPYEPREPRPKPYFPWKVEDTAKKDDTP
jgi:hypothetical protein